MTITLTSGYDRDVEDLFDALTSYTCESYEDIANATGWSTNKVAWVLALVRRPEVAAEWGWTVPHVPRGPGEHLYQVIPTDGGQPLDADQQAHVKAGAVSTLRLCATQSENEAHALREAARYCPPVAARRMRRVARAQEAVADMSREAVEALNGAY